MEKKIKQIENLNDLEAMQIVYLNCVLMANKEIIFHGKSLGFLTDEEIKKYVFLEKGE